MQDNNRDKKKNAARVKRREELTLPQRKASQKR